MHVNFGTALVVTTLLAALVLLKTDRLFSIIAVIAAAIQTAMVFGVLTFAVAKFRVDVILPALLLISGAVLWTKVSTKSAITAATIVTLAGTMELLLAVRVLT